MSRSAWIVLACATAAVAAGGYYFATTPTARPRAEATTAPLLPVMPKTPPAIAPAPPPVVAAKPEPKPAPPPVDRTPVATLRANQLWQEFGKNAVAADQKYAGKYVRLTGQPSNITPDDSDRTAARYVTVQATGLNQRALAAMSEKERHWWNNGYPPNVVAYVDPAARTDFATPFDAVIARVKARKVADVWGGYVVELDEARPERAKPVP